MRIYTESVVALVQYPEVADRTFVDGVRRYMCTDYLAIKKEAVCSTIWAKIFPVPASVLSYLIALLKPLFWRSKATLRAFAIRHFPKYSAPALLVMAEAITPGVFSFFASVKRAFHRATPLGIHMDGIANKSKGEV
jgi:hypothetical protein